MLTGVGMCLSSLINKLVTVVNQYSGVGPKFNATLQNFYMPKHCKLICEHNGCHYRHTVVIIIWNNGANNNWCKTIWV